MLLNKYLEKNKVSDGVFKHTTEGASTQDAMMVKTTDAVGDRVKVTNPESDKAGRTGVVQRYDGDKPVVKFPDGDEKKFDLGDLVITGSKDADIPVGRHNDIPDSAFDPDELVKGIKTESEHTDDPEIAKAIAKDHLIEVKDYYTQMEKMKSSAETGDADRKYMGHTWEEIKAMQHYYDEIYHDYLKTKQK